MRAQAGERARQGTGATPRCHPLPPASERYEIDRGVSRGVAGRVLPGCGRERQQTYMWTWCATCCGAAAFSHQAGDFARGGLRGVGEGAAGDPEYCLAFLLAPVLRGGQRKRTGPEGGRLKGPLVLRAEITKSDRGATRGGLGRAWPAAVGRSKDNRCVPGVRLAGRWPRLQPRGSRLGSRLATRFGPPAGRHARVEARTAAEKDSAGAHGRRGKDRLALTTAAPCVENVQLAEREEAGSWDSPLQPRSDAVCSHHECDLVVRRGRLS